jgi:hypothetical protein
MTSWLIILRDIVVRVVVAQLSVMLKRHMSLGTLNFPLGVWLAVEVYDEQVGVVDAFLGPAFVRLFSLGNGIETI